MEIKEIEGEMADGVKYVYWTFGGSVPGSFIRTRVGDEVQFTLKKSPRQQIASQHRFTRVTGPGGGAASSLVAPGHEKLLILNVSIQDYMCTTVLQLL